MQFHGAQDAQGASPSSAPLEHRGPKVGPVRAHGSGEGWWGVLSWKKMGHLERYLLPEGQCHGKPEYGVGRAGRKEERKEKLSPIGFWTGLRVMGGN